MSDPQPPKDDTFLRKVARFVANPATDWADLTAITEEGRDLELEKSELKAMIERKRRNDFVRRREFDMLRRVRREGLSPEQLAALGSSSRLDDSESRAGDAPVAQRGGSGVKAKIDAIEKQMVGGGTRPVNLRDEGVQPSTSPGVMDRAMNHQVPADHAAKQVPTLNEDDEELLPALPPLAAEDDEFDDSYPNPRGKALPPDHRLERPTIPSMLDDVDDSLPPPPPTAPSGGRLAAPKQQPAGAPMFMSSGLPPLTPARNSQMMALNSPFDTVEVGEVVHDPELDPSVISFANADFEECEHTLTGLTKTGGRRAGHAETWLVLFDLFRATGQHHKFESLALDYAQQFGSSAPQWYSLPKMVADAAASETPKLPRTRGEIGWVCPQMLDRDGVSKLAATVLQLPLPWVFDWGALRSMDAEAAGGISELMRQWAGQALEMRWLSGERFFQVVDEIAPSGARDADPVFWQVRLDALRLANRPDQFDDMAIEYCVTYEVSPPSWEPAKALVRIGGAGLTTQSPRLSQVSDASTALTTTHESDETNTVRMATMDLSGQLVGDIASTLSRMNGEIGDASFVKVSCTRLIRVDFVAAGDLLNWVMTKRSEGRTVALIDAHRLVALFFGAMGITEYASVRIRMV